MPRTRQIVFAVSILALSWLGMMAVHELGHVLGAVVTGGTIERCVLHPLAISRTDVVPNPHPVVVVWMGPIVGSVLPLAALCLLPSHFPVARRIVQFFVGFCLIANGAYIGIGWIDRVGDCREMLQNGVPIWSLATFGCVSLSAGFYLWHRLGSVRHFLSTPALVTHGMAVSAALTLVVTTAVAAVLSPR